MREVSIEKAFGMVPGHDVAMIVPGPFKEVAFHKGDVIRE